MRFITSFLIFLVVLPTTISPAKAGPFADELSKCLVESTSQRDRTQLAQWFFTAASLHPAVKPLTSVTESQLDAANKTVAELMVRLLTESCRSETEAALQYEGLSTIETGFKVLGEVAGMELFSSPEVKEGLAGLEEHLDVDALSSLKGLQ